MADQYTNDNTINSTRVNAIDDSVDYDPSSDAAVTGDNRAYPNHGIDGRSGDDAAKGGIAGAIGGAVVGAFAGGPVGAVIGAVVGGVASDAGVAAVDRIDNDNSPGENQTYRGSNDDLTRGTTASAIDYNADNDAYVDHLDTAGIAGNRAGISSSGSAALDGSAEYDANGNRIR